MREPSLLGGVVLVLEDLDGHLLLDGRRLDVVSLVASLFRVQEVGEGVDRDAVDDHCVEQDLEDGWCPSQVDGVLPHL